jgi:membrane associated rhomboid family serine protease
MGVSDRDYMRPGSSSAPQRILRRVRRRVITLRAFGWVLALMSGVFMMQHGFRLLGDSDPVAGYVPWGGVSIQKLASGHAWTLFTHLFVHGGLLHFAMNLCFFWFAGRGVQDLVGSRHFVKIFALSGFVGAAMQMVVNAFGFADKVTPLVGASAAIFGLLMTYAVLQPNEPIDVMVYYILPIPMRLWTLAKWFFIANVVLGVTSVVFTRALPPGMTMAYFAHIGGAVTGWLYARALGYGEKPMTYASQWRPRELQEQEPVLANVPRIGARVDVDLEAASAPPAAPPAAQRSLGEQVDAILDKMNELGQDSLSPEEKELLVKASQQMK